MKKIDLPILNMIILQHEELSMYKNIILTILIAFLSFGCDDKKGKRIVIYTSVDQVYSSKIFDEYTQQTGTKVYPR